MPHWISTTDFFDESFEKIVYGITSSHMFCTTCASGLPLIWGTNYMDHQFSVICCNDNNGFSNSVYLITTTISKAYEQYGS